jgi:hypothetical protein
MSTKPITDKNPISDAPMQEEVKEATSGDIIKKALGKRKRVNKNQRRKLRRIMNPDSNLIRDNEMQVMSVQSSRKESAMEDEVPKTSENKVIAKLLNQIEFYMGDANLSKDQFLQKRLEKTTQLELTLFLEFNRIKCIFSAGGITDKLE